MKLLLVLACFSGGLSACQLPDLFNTDGPQAVVGTWVYEGWSSADTASVYGRRDRLDDNQYGYVFLPDGRMIQRVNAGWCGTPPITTADYPGSWQAQRNQLVIQSADWSGQGTHAYTIVRRQADKLVLRY